MADIAFQPTLKTASIEEPPTESTMPSTLAFGIVKGGSTLLFKLLAGAAGRVGMTYVAVDDVLFGRGTVGPDRPGRIDMTFAERGYCYGGFRRYPRYPLPLIEQARTVWLVRDPRDMIVSLYYSLAYSHSEPGGPDSPASERFRASREVVKDMDIDRFALSRTILYVRILEGYYAQGFPARGNVRIYRYEDVIFEKRAWLADMCAWLGWELGEADVDEIVTPHDVVPEEEDPTRHIRRVRPGGWRDRLAPRAVRRIEAQLAEFMREFGYAPAG